MGTSLDKELFNAMATVLKQLPNAVCVKCNPTQLGDEYLGYYIFFSNHVVGNFGGNLGHCCKNERDAWILASERANPITHPNRCLYLP